MEKALEQHRELNARLMEIVGQCVQDANARAVASERRAQIARAVADVRNKFDARAETAYRLDGLNALRAVSSAMEDPLLRAALKLAARAEAAPDLVEEVDALLALRDLLARQDEPLGHAVDRVFNP